MNDKLAGQEKARRRETRDDPAPSIPEDVTFPIVRASRFPGGLTFSASDDMYFLCRTSKKSGVADGGATKEAITKEVGIVRGRFGGPLFVHFFSLRSFELFLVSCCLIPSIEKRR